MPIRGAKGNVSTRSLLFPELDGCRVYLRVLGMRRVVRILCLLSDQSRVELLISVYVAGVDVLGWLAVRPLDGVSKC